MSAAEKPCTPAGYEQSPGAQPLSPAKKRRKAQRSNSTAQGGPPAASQQSDTMSLPPSSAAGLKMRDSEAAAAAAANGGIMAQRGAFDDSSMAMQAAIGGQQQQMMAAVQQHGHQRHILYPGARPVVSGPTEHLLQPQGMQGGRASMGLMNMMPSQGMPYGYAANVCGGCRQDLQDYSQAIMCGSGCNLWFHRHCSGLNEFAYQLLVKEPCAEWVCDSCYKQKNIPPMKPRLNNN